MTSIRRELLFWLLTGLSVAVAAAAVGTYYRARVEANELFDHQLQELASSLTDAPFGAAPDGAAGSGSGDDALVLDLGLPKRTGLEVLGAMRKSGDSRPVLVLTARDAVADRVAGLDAGADDYVVKPFDLNELAARLRALLRRGSGRAGRLLASGDVEIDPSTREVRFKGELVAVSPREFALLEALLTRPGVILSRAQLEDKLYGWSDPVESNAVEVHIHSLRKKLGADFIRNVRGVGWMVARGSAAATAASVRVHT